ncbi:C4-dicarboxylate ABC transporter, partial [Myxococcota bacterium]|nr:C4-dicarboxylate ABC transporter [Myxococcota bacterium]
LTGEVDGFARVLYYFGLFTFLLLMTLIGRFLKLPFFVSWWAYTFPLDALTISTLLLYAKTKLPIFQAMAYTFLLLTSVVIVAVLLRTLWAGVKGEICVPE